MNKITTITCERVNSKLPEIKKGRMTLREISVGYQNTLEDEGGNVTSLSEKLIIHPEFQRAYVVGDNISWRMNLIFSVVQKMPINPVYFGVNKNGTWTVIDGQQRLITLLDFIAGNEAYNITIGGIGKSRLFSTLPENIQNDILDYPIDINFCEGTIEEQLKWFETINQPTFVLNDQELLNSTCGGSFVESAKRKFSVPTSKAKKRGEFLREDSPYYLGHFCGKKKADRQEYLEQALDWASLIEYGDETGMEKYDRIRLYMENHQNDVDASCLVNTTKEIIDWVLDTFFKEYIPNSWQSLSKVNWAKLYLNYGNVVYTREQKDHFTTRCKVLVNNYKAFENVSGVYEWVIRGEKDEEIKLLSFRGFGQMDKDNMYANQCGIDPIDGKHYEMHEMHAHHIKSWKNGGVSDFENLVWLSIENHRKLHAGDYGLTPQELREKRDAIRKANGYL